MSNDLEPSLKVLRAGLRELGLPLDVAVADRFQRYFGLISAGGDRFGLTTVTGYDEVQRRHFLEPAALALLLQKRGLLPAGVRLLDLGAGAGVPGIPVKLLFPPVDLTLVEATKKKAAWLRRVVSELGLQDVEVLAERAEDLGRDPAHREQYDMVTARAVAELRVLLELAMPLLRVGGVLAAPKGERAAEEVREAARAAGMLGAEIEVEPLHVPFSPREQLLVLASKTEHTDERFPRRPGISAKRPL